MITITESAQGYLAELLEKQTEKYIGVRIFVSDPGTPKAETCIAYCSETDPKEDDIVFDCGRFQAYIDKKSEPFLEDASVNYDKDQFGGQLTIKAPYSRTPKITDDSNLEEKINFYLQSEVNPNLASHGGQVSLVELIEEEEGSFAVLQFGGGCQGCGMVDVTLKDGVEATLLERIPELKGVRDMTDHSDTSNAYFK